MVPAALWSSGSAVLASGQAPAPLPSAFAGLRWFSTDGPSPTKKSCPERVAPRAFARTPGEGLSVEQALRAFDLYPELFYN